MNWCYHCVEIGNLIDVDLPERAHNEIDVPNEFIQSIKYHVYCCHQFDVVLYGIELLVDFI